jgi:hypothetical protein
MADKSLTASLSPFLLAAKPMVKLCNKYGFRVVYGIVNEYVTGIGDILYSILGIKHNIIKAPIHFSLTMFLRTHKNDYYINPLNALEFRLQLISDLLDANQIPRTSVLFSMSNRYRLIEPTIHNKLDILNLKIPSNPLFKMPIAQPYIIIHTKMRHHSGASNYVPLINAIKLFASNFKTDYTIVLLGEKEMFKTNEVALLNIQTCYNELLPLADTNTLIDLTTQCFDLLDYKQYMNDIHIITNAVANISFGGGGSFCSAMIFGSCTYAHQNIVEYKPAALAAHDCHIYKEIEPMIADICVRFGNKI